MVDWLVDRSISDWLIDWSINRLIDRIYLWDEERISQDIAEIENANHITNQSTELERPGTLHNAKIMHTSVRSANSARCLL